MVCSKVLSRAFFVLLTAIILLFHPVTAAQAATWLKNFVPYNETNTTVSNNDGGESIHQLSDGNFLIASFSDTIEPGQDVLNGIYFDNMLIQKVDGEGNIIWEFGVGGPTKSHEVLTSFTECVGGGFLLGGHSDKPGSQDFLVIKLDNSGAIVWQKVFGGLGTEQLTDLLELPSGEIVLTGISNSAGGFGGFDGVLIKLDSSGNPLWQQNYGLAGDDTLQALDTTSDGGFVMAGKTASFGGIWQAWIVKTNANGDADGSPGTWSRHLGGPQIEEFNDIIETADGNFVAVGEQAFSIPITPGDGLIVKYDNTGTLVWQRILDDGPINQYDELKSIVETTTNDFIVGGITSSWGAGQEDGWLLKMDSAGRILWQRTFGDAQDQSIEHISLAADTGILMAGATSTPTTGKNDIWAGKTDANGLFDDADCTTSAVSAATPLDPLLASNDAGKISGPIVYSFQNATHASVPVASNTIEDNSYCVSYLEISGDSNTIAGNSNELTISAYDTYGTVRTGYSGIKNLTFSGLANDGVKFPTLEGVVIGAAQPVTFTAGVSNALTTTLVPQIAEVATVAVTDGKYNCNPINAEPTHCLPLTVRAPLTTWSAQFDSGLEDRAKTVAVAPDGNYIVASNTLSFATIQKLDQAGAVLWETSLNDIGGVTVSNLEIAPDGSMLLGAQNNSSGSNDILLVKLDASGNILWQYQFDNAGLPDSISKVYQTADGGYVMIGESDLDPFLAPLSEALIIRLDAAGNVLWQNLYGGPDFDRLTDIYENADGSFLVAGWSQSFPPAPNGEYVGWMFKIDNRGNLLWSNTYDIMVNDPIRGPGTAASTFFNKIIPSANLGKFVLAGRNFVSFGGDYQDAMLMQIDGNGALEWVYNYGDGTGLAEEFHEIMAGGGDYIMAGATNAFGSGGNDGMVVFVNSFTQSVRKAKALGDTIGNYLYSLDAALDGGLILAGKSQHPPAARHHDVWVVKTDAAAEVTDPNCLQTTDITALLARTIPVNRVTDVTALVTVKPIVLPPTPGSLTQALPGLSKLSFCTAYFLITGAAAMTAGTTNELTLTAYDYLGNVVASYDGPKYLNFSGLSPIGIYSPNVEGTNFGNPTRIDFVAGASTLAGATLTAFRDEVSTVHASEGAVTSVPHDGLPNGGLPLSVTFAPISRYAVSATSPQSSGTGWSELVTALDLYGNVAKFNSAFSMSNNGQVRFYSDNTYSFANNAYSLVNGVASIFLYDYYPETINLTASDATGKTGTSGPITITGGGGAAAGGSGGSGPGMPVSGGSSSGGYRDDSQQPAATFLASPAESDSAEPPSLSCLSQIEPSQMFVDIAGHYAENAIKILSRVSNGQQPIVSGYLDGSGNALFRPDLPVSRAEFLKMALVANCLPIEPIGPEAGQLSEMTFNDVSVDEGVWYNSFIYSAVKQGIVVGYPDGTFRPDQPISRAEATKILVNIQKLIGEDYQPKVYFEDVLESDWFFAYVSAGKENGLIFGSSDENGSSLFRPHDPISRADSTLILVRILGLRDFISLGDQNANTYSFLQG